MFNIGDKVRIKGINRLKNELKLTQPNGLIDGFLLKSDFYFASEMTMNCGNLTRIAGFFSGESKYYELLGTPFAWCDELLVDADDDAWDYDGYILREA